MRKLFVLGLTLLIGTSACASRHKPNLATPSGVHRLSDGGCVDFARLPSVWSAVPQAPIHDAAVVIGSVRGVPVKMAIRTDGLYTDVYAPSVIGWRRLPARDVSEFTAWMADDGELVLANGNRRTYSVIIDCEPQNTRLRTAATCHVSDHHLPKGRLLEIQFSWADLQGASTLINAAEHVAARLTVSCPG